jgi:uridine kinase
MKLCFLITGFLRNFSNGLYPFLKELSTLIELDLYIYTTKETLDSKFQVNQEKTKNAALLQEPFCKLFAIDSNTISNLDHLSQREKNLLYQWKKIYLGFQSIPENDYDFIVRIRPDVQLLISPLEFLERISSLPTSGLSIPQGNDLYSSKLQLEKPSINDQIAIGTYSQMKVYANFYPYLLEVKSKETPIISEVYLYEYLTANQIPLHRFNLPYSLYLSDCSVLAICGNSGAGKSKVLSSLQKIFPFDSSLVIETDRYHKWERHSKEWKEYTHLHPMANNLEKLTDDTYQLKIGETIEIVDYDHTNGKFTSPMSIQPKNYVFLCGLHTLYKESMRNQLDFKMYIDTEEKLNRYWKIRRDLHQRGHTIDQVLKNIAKRKIDYEKFILSQKQYADCIVRIEYKNEVPDYTDGIDETQLSYTITIRKSFVGSVGKLLSTFSTLQTIHPETITYSLYNHIPKEQLVEYILKEQIPIVNLSNLDKQYLGVLQLLILFILFK